MASRTFDSSDFASITALTACQLINAVKEQPPEIILGKLCEKLDGLRADQVKALAIQNLYRSEEWKNRLWYVGANEEYVQQDQHATLSRHRTQRSKFCNDGIGLTVAWANRLELIIGRLDIVFQEWATLCEQVLLHGEPAIEICFDTAQKIVSEQRWLRDQIGMASVSMSIIANHRGVKDLNFVCEGVGDVPPRSMFAKFTWVSFR